jgi:hypothetical protein
MRYPHRATTASHYGRTDGRTGGRAGEVGAVIGWLGLSLAGHEMNIDRGLGSGLPRAGDRQDHEWVWVVAAAVPVGALLGAHAQSGGDSGRL